MEPVAIAVDLGGTNLRCSVVDRNGKLLVETRQPTGAGDGPDQVIARIARMIESVATQANLDMEVGVGVAAPGPLDTKSGIVRYTPNLEGWHDVPLRDELEKLTGHEVVLGNDVNASALGEFYFGAASDVEHMVLVAIGTGFGGGVISDGRLIDGPRGLGGELGHTTVSMGGPRCTCGSTGCVEAFCSGWAIERDGQQVVRSGRSEKIRELAGDGMITARTVSRAAKAGDEAALGIFERAGTALGVALASFVNIFSPEMIVVGGGLSRAGDILLDPAKRALRANAMPDLLESVEIRTSALGTKTGTYGAAALVFYSKQL